VPLSTLVRPRVQGGRIVGPDGRPLLLRGVNMDGEHYHIGPGYDPRRGPTQQAIPAAARWGANILMHGFASRPILEGITLNRTGATVTRAQYLGFLDELVRLTREWGMYLVLAYRMPLIDVEQPPYPDGDARRALTALAARYRDEAHVMYSTQVESHDVDWGFLRPLWEVMIDEVRVATAPHTPIVMVSGPEWGRRIADATIDPVRRDHVVYKTHYYSVPGESTDDLVAHFLPAVEAGLPVFFGEFGDDGADIVLPIARRHEIGWCAWQFWEEGPPTLVRSLTDFAPTAWGNTIRAELLAQPPP